MTALNLFKKVKTEGALPYSFYKARVIVLSKPGRDKDIHTNKTKQANKLWANSSSSRNTDVKFLTKILANQTQAYMFL